MESITSVNVMITVALITLTSVLCFLFWITRDHLSHLPGPSLWRLMWNYSAKPSATHVLLSQLEQEYGPIFKIPQFAENSMVVLNDYDSIYHALVKEGKLFGGRPNNFRLTSILAQTGILQSYDPGETWKSLRKTAQRHLKQFGDGMSRLEFTIVSISENMFSEFAIEVGKPYDPKNIVVATALNIIAFLLVGKFCKAGDDVLENMRNYEALFLEIVSVTAPLEMKMLDVCPWLRHFGTKSWKLILKILQLESDIWQSAKRFSENNPDAESIYKIFNQQITADKMTEKDGVKTMFALLLGGVATTSSAFYAAINLLAHHQDIQEKLYAEIKKIREETGCDPCLQDRPKMHYSKAVIWEILRYVNVAPLGAIHRNREETDIRGYTIPANTLIVTALWNLHKDERFWGDPHVFRPARFLDDEGHILPPDHPNRKHLMPFGAGTRVCLGETLALTRLFIWLTTSVKRFKIFPAPGNLPSSTDARLFEFVALLKPTPYEVIFDKR